MSLLQRITEAKLQVGNVVAPQPAALPGGVAPPNPATATCGVFIPIPSNVARLFPAKPQEEDPTDPHVTLLYVGDASPQDQAKVVQAVQAVARRWPPIRVSMFAYAEFQNHKGQTIAHMVPEATVAISVNDGTGVAYKTLADLHAELADAVAATGVKAAHNYGGKTPPPNERAAHYKSHVTLAYVEPGAPPYSGPKPTSFFNVTELEVWGWEKYRIPLGNSTPANSTATWKPKTAPAIKEDSMDATGLVPQEKRFNLYTRSIPKPHGVPHPAEVDRSGPTRSAGITPEDEINVANGLDKSVRAREASKQARKQAQREAQEGRGPLQTEDFHEPHDEKLKHELYASINKRASQLIGKPVHLIYPHYGPKGMDASFKEGGSFKIRPKGSTITVKIAGNPSPSSRWVGSGSSVGAALAALKPEAKETSPALSAIVAAATKSPSPKKPTSTVKPTAPGATTPAGVGLPAKPMKPIKVSAAAPLKADAPKPPQREVVGGIALHNDLGVDEATFDRYGHGLKLATDLMRQRGFGFMLGRATMHLRQSKEPGILGNFTGADEFRKNKDGSIFLDKDGKPVYIHPEVEIFVNTLGKSARPEDIALVMIHEMGHHYYYREIPRGDRKKYAWYFNRAWGDTTNEPHAQDNRKTKEIDAAVKAGAFPSHYGATKRYEDFAEIFAAFVGRGPKMGKATRYQLTPDVMQRFRTFMANDKRVDLRSEDRPTRFDALLAEEGSFPLPRPKKNPFAPKDDPKGPPKGPPKAAPKGKAPPWAKQEPDPDAEPSQATDPADPADPNAATDQPQDAEALAQEPEQDAPQEPESEPTAPGQGPTNRGAPDKPQDEPQDAAPDQQPPGSQFGQQPDESPTDQPTDGDPEQPEQPSLAPPEAEPDPTAPPVLGQPGQLGAHPPQQGEPGSMFAKDPLAKPDQLGQPQSSRFDQALGQPAQPGQAMAGAPMLAQAALPPQIPGQAPETNPVHRVGHAMIVGVEHGKPITLPAQALADAQTYAKHGVYIEGSEAEPVVAAFIAAHLGGAQAATWEPPTAPPGTPRWIASLGLSIFGGTTDAIYNQIVTSPNFDPAKTIHDNLLATADAWHHPEAGHHVSSHDLNMLVKMVADDPGAQAVTADARDLHKLLHGPMASFRKFHKTGFAVGFPHDSGFHEHHTKLARVLDTENAARDAHLAHQMRSKGGVYFAGSDHVGAVLSRMKRTGAARSKMEAAMPNRFDDLLMEGKKDEPVHTGEIPFDHEPVDEDSTYERAREDRVNIWWYHGCADRGDGAPL